MEVNKTTAPRKSLINSKLSFQGQVYRTNMYRRWCKKQKSIIYLV